MLASTLKPRAPVLVTGMASPVSGLVQTALAPPTWTRLYPDCCVSLTATGAVVVPPGNVRLKFNAPVPVAVAPLAGSMVTPDAEVLAPNVHPPAGVAPVVLPAGAVLATTCFTTVTDPVQLPRARFFRIVPTSS